MACRGCTRRLRCPPNQSGTTPGSAARRRNSRARRDETKECNSNVVGAVAAFCIHSTDSTAPRRRRPGPFNVGVPRNARCQEPGRAAAPEIFPGGGAVAPNETLRADKRARGRRETPEESAGESCAWRRSRNSNKLSFAERNTRSVRTIILRDAAGSGPRGPCCPGNAGRPRRPVRCGSLSQKSRNVSLSRSFFGVPFLSRSRNLTVSLSYSLTFSAFYNFTISFVNCLTLSFYHFFKFRRSYGVSFLFSHSFTFSKSRRVTLSFFHIFGISRWYSLGF